MLRKTFVFIALGVALAVAASQAVAASVHLELIYNPTSIGCVGCTLSGAGTYQLFASASAGDNQGIAGYGISVQNVSSFLHRAPRVNSSETPDGDIFPAGFTLLRSANNATALGTGFLIGAGQDTVAPTPYIIHGFGQTASNVAAEIPAENTNGGIIQAEWGAKLLMGEGMFTGAIPDIDLENVDVFVNLFGPVGGADILTADLTKQICEGVCGIVDENTPPVIGDLGPLVGDMSLNGANVPTIVSGTLPADDNQLPGTPLAWSILGAPVGPGAPVIAPTIDPATGLFSWNVDGSRGGLYQFTIQALDNGLPGTGGPLSDTGILSVNVIVPEPASIALFSVALVGCIGFLRRRS